jgi:hypothetical protein
MSIESYLAESENLLSSIEKIRKFNSNYGVFPSKKIHSLIDRMKSFSSSIPEITTVETFDDLLQFEMKRRIDGEILSFEQFLGSNYYDFETTISMYAIPKSDIESLHPWLVENKERTMDAIERLYENKDVKFYNLGLPADIPSVRRQVEEFASINIQKYHKRLGGMIQDLTSVGGFLREIDAVATTNPRSYFNQLTKILAIGISAFCFTTEDGGLQIKERNLISLYGHEGMGHALNKVITRFGNLPYFLKTESQSAVSTMESLAQYYQRIIFEDLKNSVETQKQLGIEHKFEDIYREEKDISMLEEYKSKLFQYSITALADKTLGDPLDKKTLMKKIELLNEVTIDPNQSLNFIEQNRFNFDSRGNLNSQLVGELRYCAQPVKRAILEFEKRGIHYSGKERGLIDSTLLNGFWSPTGYVEYAKLKAKENTE